MIKTQEVVVVHLVDAASPPEELQLEKYKVITINDLASLPDAESCVVAIDSLRLESWCEQLKQHPNRGKISILALIPNNNYSLHRALDAGADDYLVKPIDPVLLDHRINALLKLHLSSYANTQAEEKYRRLFNAANDAIIITDLLTGHILDVNQYAVKWLGYTHADMLTMTYDQVIDETTNQGIPVDAFAGLSTSGHMIYDQTFKTADYELIPAEVSSRLLNFGGRRAILNIARDISKRKAIELAERNQRQLAEALHQTAEDINSTLDIQEIVQRVIHHAFAVLGGDYINLMLIDGDVAHVQAHLGYDEQTAQEISNIEWNIQQTTPLRLIMENKSAILVADIQAHPDWTPHVKSESRAYVGAPIIVEEEIAGFINIGHREPNGFQRGDANTLQAFANQAAIAIQNARLHQAVQHYAEELESRVEQRTTELRSANLSLQQQMEERQRAEKALQDERSLLRSLIDNIPDEIYVKDTEGRIILANRALTRRLRDQAPDGEVIGSTDFDYINEYMPEGHTLFLQTRERELLESGKAIIDEELPVYDNDIPRHWFSVTKVPLVDSDQKLMGLVGVNHDITELKRAEERLEHIISGAACLLWYAIVEELPDETPVVSLHVSSHNAAQNFLPLKLEPGESYEQAWQASILEEDRSVRDEAIKNALLNEKNGYELVFRCSREDGEIRWLREVVQVRALTPGRYNFVGVCTDVTEQKEAEQTLQRTNELLEQRVRERTRELTENNEILMEQIAERNRVERAEREQRRLAEALSDASRALSETLELNEVLDRILMYLGRVMPSHDQASVELIEDSIYVRTLRRLTYTLDGVEISSPKERFYMDSLPKLREIYSSGQPVLIADTLSDPDWVALEHVQNVRSYVCVPISVESHVIGFITLFSRTPHQLAPVRTEQLTAFASQAGIAIQNARLFETVRNHVVELGARVQERTRELENERAQLAAILNAMTEGVIYSDSNDHALYINQSMAELTGYKPNEWINKTWPTVILSESDQQEMMTANREVMNRRGIWHGEVKVVRKDGDQFDAKIVSTLVTRADGFPVGSVTVIRDISAEKRLEAQKSRFIAIASHELRTPITNLNTRLYLMKKQPARLDEHLQVMTKVIDHTRKLVEDLLDLSRFEHGIISMERERVVLQNVLEKVIQIQKPEAANKSIDLLYSAPEAPAHVSVDTTRMTQVFTNLITNAINYTPDNGQIQVNIHVEGDMSIIDIRDNGIGIPEELLTQVFQPFFRVEDHSKGMGLGLNITKEIIEAHEGEITVESAVNQGTGFCVKLPLA